MYSAHRALQQHGKERHRGEFELMILQQKVRIEADQRWAGTSDGQGARRAVYAWSSPSQPPLCVWTKGKQGEALTPGQVQASRQQTVPALGLAAD